MIVLGRHRALTQDAWSELAVRAAIEEIAADAIAHFDPDTFWPGHPSDDGVGAALLAMRLAPTSSLADLVHSRAEANMGLPIRELMWGMPGSMLAAIHMAEMTQETRWRGLFEMQAARLLADLEDTPQGPLWTQDLYGERRPLARARSRFRRQCHPVIARVGLVDADAASAGGRVCAEDSRSECVAV